MIDFPFGLVYTGCGDAGFEDKTLSQFIQDFEDNHILEKDTIEDVANKLFKLIPDSCVEADFIIAGYDREEQFVYNVQKNSISRINEPRDGIQAYSATWSGDTEPLDKLLCTKPEFQFAYNTFSLRDSVDFAEFIVDTTIKCERFREGPKVCGGPIDILVITKSDAFWYRHKLFPVAESEHIDNKEK